MMDAVRNRLAMQNEILKKVEELAQRMQIRAEQVTKEVRDLEDSAAAAEVDLSSAVGAFNRLSDTRFVENKIAEGDENSFSRESCKTSTIREIPAQIYEVDILPRYKEALSLGLSSFKDHHKNADKKYTGRSIFNPWLVRGPLPHIIGSEEFIHDSTCGLISEDLNFGSSVDSGEVEKPTGLFDPEPVDLFNASLFGPSENNESEPLVSAASDFKAMLEAALRSPYKFYDGDGSSQSTWAAQPDLTSLLSEGGLFDSGEVAGGEGDEESERAPTRSSDSISGLPDIDDEEDDGIQRVG